MSGSDGTWFDDAAGPLVRPYAMTGGRTTSRQADLEIIALVVALGPVSRAQALALDDECLQILELVQQPASVAEISAGLRLPLSVTKILLGDLIDKKLVAFRSAVTPDIHVLQAVINGIRKL
ncbi:DUF742 domain-containing protein [Kineosporia succinea]|uniref:DUF742 domain-containing protein n=1 Tax=Kineosporia succinea TaxID=84632 RepID=A0ABT9P6T1_9ACTN|nr:DUF742 domain-containing protein [Kineosporia succinea]MDP9828412.1 hypothetical protein [Kineosporia succinea]